MKTPLSVQELTVEERADLEAGLRSPEAFTLRRSQILLASAQGQRPSRIAANVGCCVQTVRNVIHAFHQRRTQALVRGSSRPKTARPHLRAEHKERIREILHRSPRAFGKATSLWTLPLLSELLFEQGVTAHKLSGESVRRSLKRMGIVWKRAERWWKRAERRIRSPDPAYARKKGRETD